MRVEIHHHESGIFTSFTVALPLSWYESSVEAILQRFGQMAQISVHGMRLMSTDGALFMSSAKIRHCLRDNASYFIVPEFSALPGSPASVTPSATLGVRQCDKCTSWCLQWEGDCWECGAASHKVAMDVHVGSGWTCPHCSAHCVVFDTSCWSCAHRRDTCPDAMCAVVNE